MRRGTAGRRAGALPLRVMALVLVLGCEGAPEKPDRGGPWDPGTTDPGRDEAPEATGEVAAPDCSQTPREAGCPCEEPGDCRSGHCLARSSRCAAECRSSADCDGQDQVCGLVFGLSRPVCLDRFPSACLPCEQDADCADLNATTPSACLRLDDRSLAFCLPECGPEGTCPQGLSCRLEENPPRCLPDSGKCPCSPEAARIGRMDLEGCEDYLRDDDGDLYGREDDSRCLCGPLTPFQARQAGDCDDQDDLVFPGAPERCNGKDDDCNGATDDGLGLPQSPCSRQGVCEAAPVKASCVGGNWVCDYREVAAYEEVEVSCDGKDNDCDGLTDEGLADQPGHCLFEGVCAGAPVRSRCQQGEWVCDYREVEGYEETEVSCDGRDNDCNGRTDDTFFWADPVSGASLPIGAACGTGRCEGGKVVCGADGRFAECDSAGWALPETCNDRDDDCDGQVDEDFRWEGQTIYRDPASPYLGPNSCRGTGRCATQEGVIECLDLERAGCSVNPGGSQDLSVVESCNLQDDDCDGLTDEDIHAPPDGVCPDTGLCATGWKNLWARCVEGQLVCVFDGLAGYSPGAETACDGVDENCNGRTDEDFHWLPPARWPGSPPAVGEPCGMGSCAGGVVQCRPDRQTADCSTDRNAAQERCDGRDNDCDGLTDEDFSWQGATVLLDPGDPTKGHSACLGIGECALYPGEVECQGPDRAGCSTNPGGSSPLDTPETCNGRDDDCDGQTDENLGLEDSDCRRVGVCAPALVKAACTQGRWVCDYSAIPVYEGGREVSCDGLDNDCDGQTDEDFTWRDWNGQDRRLGDPCGTGECANGTTVCRDDRTGLTCSTLGRSLPESCNGRDDDCDGQTDEQGATLCNDQKPCTNDSCRQGHCENLLAAGWCLIDGQCWVDGAFHPSIPCQWCRTSVSTSSWSPTPEGGFCNADSNGCTVGDTCDALARCNAGPPADCSALDTTCALGTCENTGVSTFRCVATPRNNGGACDDGDPCTRNDSCALGSCIGVSYSCDDGLDCTTDSCNGAGGCSHAVRSGWCAIGGACWPEGTRNPANSCQACDPASSPVSWTTRPSGSDCSDGSACTTGDRCVGGQCQPTGTVDCNDGNACTEDTCNPGAPSPGEACSHRALTGTSCDDGNDCTYPDLCQAGACAGTPYTCTPPGSCVTSTCDGRGGCLDKILANYCFIQGVCHDSGAEKPGFPCLYCNPTVSKTSWTQRPKDTPCSDGDACTAGDRCVDGSCQPLGPTNCDDGNVCTDDSCISPTGCRHQNNSNLCSDGNACTVNDQCSGGVCIPGISRTCPAINPDCDPGDGACKCGSGASAVICNPLATSSCQNGSCRCGSIPACDSASPNPECDAANSRCVCHGVVCDPLRSDWCDGNTCRCGTGPQCNSGFYCDSVGCIPF